jgi:putative ABC transport system substrate-binding protein
MEQKIAIFVVLIGILAPLRPAEAQKPTKIYRIGYVSPRLGLEPREEAFRKGLRDLGYIEGQNIVIEWRFAKGKADRLPDLVAELVNLKVDLLVTAGGPASHAAKNASSTIPIVMTQASDPVHSGLVSSLAHPGGNVTGLSLVRGDLGGKRMELLKETVPKASRMAVIFNPEASGPALEFKEMPVIARALGVKLQSVEVRKPAEFELAFSAIIREQSNAVVVLNDPLFSSNRKPIVELAAKSRLPTIYAEQEWVRVGGLMSYGANRTDLARRAATYVDKILKGAKPADLPVEEPTDFEFMINLKTAKQIGVTIARALLALADEVIQ